MIVFLAPDPQKTKAREGFLQRVAAIDKIFSDEKRIYHEDTSDDNEQLAKDLVSADLIYVHSIYHSRKILLCYPILADKIITDLHGVVPEEIEYSGDTDSSRALSAVEKIVFTHGKNFVAVSQAMVDHFSRKYKLSTEVKWAILPIFESENTVNVEKKKINNNVIYAGGAQKWQNVDLMVGAINGAMSRYSYTILTHTPEAFRDIDREKVEQIEITTVESSDVGRYYENASMGFCLRDDITINNVACPTKMIEYMSSGIAPIVLSPNIGDFNRLGYSYITLNDFVSGKTTERVVRSIIEKNLKVLQKLIKQTDKGVSDLRALAEALRLKHVKESRYPQVLEYIMAFNLIQNQNEELLRNKQAIAKNEEAINEYKNNLEQQEEYIQKTLQSRRWKIFTLITKPIASVRKLKKKLGL